MTFSRAEADRYWQERAREKAKTREPELRMAVQAAVAAEYLTGDERWDYFLSLVQAKADELRRERDHWDEQLRSSDVVDPSEMARAKLGRAEAQAALDALRWCVEQPTRVIEAGNRAKQVLSA